MKISFEPTDSWHQSLISKSTTYKKWHETKFHHHIHWGIFIFFSLLMIPFLVFGTSTYAGTANKTLTFENSSGETWDYAKINFYTNKDVAVANGQDSISISVKSMVLFADAGHEGASPENPVPDCAVISGVEYPQKYKVAVSGTGNNYNTELFPVSCSTGVATISLTSTVAQSKTLTLLRNAKPEPGSTGLTLTVNFTAPVTTTSTAPKATNQTAPVAAVTAPTAVAPIVEMKIASLQVDTNTKTISQTLTTEKPIVLSGKTTPNSKVTLYIYSDPIVATTNSDANGDWSYTIASLPSGDHRVEAAVTDSAGKTSEKLEVAKFAVAGAVSDSKNVKVETAELKNNNWMYYSLGGIIILTLGGLVIFYLLRKKNS